MFKRYLKIKYSKPIFPVVLLDSGIMAMTWSSSLAFLKTSSNVYHHIGIYCYKVSLLKKYVNLENTKNEIENRLEQLRALDNDIIINVALAKSSPIGIDTKEDYLALKKIMEYKS